MRRFELVIKQGRKIETKIMRANNIGSLVGMAQDMIRDDFSIKTITVIDLVTDELIVVR